MLGVILWCDPQNKKAVVWCEDQEDLAFLLRRDAKDLPENFLEVGDMVEVDVFMNHNLRLVRRIRLVATAGRVNLPKELQKVAAADQQKTYVSKSAEIIPFPTAARSGSSRFLDSKNYVNPNRRQSDVDVVDRKVRSKMRKLR